MLESIIASIGYAGGIIADKLILSKYKVPVMRFIPLLFVWLAIITAVFLPKYGGFEINLISDYRYILLFLLMIVLALAWNIFFYKGIQKEEIHEFELIMLLSPLVTVLLAEIFLPAERNLSTFIAAIIASGALILTRFHHHHVKVGKVAWLTILAMILMSFESIVIKHLLDVFSPVTLYFIRTSVLAFAFIILYKPKLMVMKKEAYALTIISAIFGVMQMVLKFYGFRELGVIETTLILVLGPFLVYFFSASFFKEKLYKRDIFAALVVVACVLYVTFG